MKNKSLDIDFVRKQFPGLANGWVFFDNAGGTQILSRVVDRMTDFLFNKNVQIGGSYDISLQAEQALFDGREAMMHLINASRPEEIAFAPTSTVALQNLARSMRSQLKAGDEIIVTNSDHESNIGPWVRLEERGVIIKFWEINADSLELDLADLEKIMSDKTKLVCVTHVSNILGTINPVAEIAEFVHERGALICLDSVAYAPHRSIDVQNWDIDYLVFSTYKVFGPHFSVLYGKYDLFLRLDNLYHYFYDKSKVPSKLEAGNASYELAYGSIGIVDYLCELGERAGCNGSKHEKISLAYECITLHENQLAEKLLSYLRDRSDCQIVGHTRGDDPRRVPTISFIIEGHDAGDIAKKVDEFKVAIRFGDFHARRLAEFLELSKRGGVVRVSLTHYNTLEEVDSLIRALETVLA